MREKVAKSLEQNGVEGVAWGTKQQQQINGALHLYGCINFSRLSTLWNRILTENQFKWLFVRYWGYIFIYIFLIFNFLIHEAPSCYSRTIYICTSSLLSQTQIWILPFLIWLVPITSSNTAYLSKLDYSIKTLQTRPYAFYFTLGNFHGLQFLF